MVDHLSKAGRSRNMAAIRSKNTGSELALRAALRAAGATGYRVHFKGLLSRPDVVFTRWKVAVFVDGAFWHGHPDHFDPARAAQVEQLRDSGDHVCGGSRHAALPATYGLLANPQTAREVALGPAEPRPRMLDHLTEGPPPRHHLIRVSCVWILKWSLLST